MLFSNRGYFGRCFDFSWVLVNAKLFSRVFFNLYFTIPGRSTSIHPTDSFVGLGKSARVWRNTGGPLSYVELARSPNPGGFGPETRVPHGGTHIDI